MLTPETMKLLRRNKINITKDENDEKVPHLESPELIFVHCNISNSDYQQDIYWYLFIPNKSFEQFLDI